MTSPATRLPDAASLELNRLDPVSVDQELVPALAAAFPGFDFSLAHKDDEYWRDTGTVIQPGSTRLGGLRPWMTAELAKDGGDVKTTWARLKETGMHITDAARAPSFCADWALAGRLHPDRARPRDRMARRPRRQS